MSSEEKDPKKKKAATGSYRKRNSPGSQGEEKKSDRKEDSFTGGLWKWLTDLLSFPVRLLLKYFRRELSAAVRHDLRIYMLLAGIAGMMFIFVVVLWLTLSIAVGVFFYEKGFTLLIAVLFSLAFQVVVILLALLTARIASHRRKTLKLVKELKDLAKEKE